jgi:hypothetical protein
MLSRRELITAGVAGGLTKGSSEAARPPVVEQEGYREIARQIQDIEGVLRNAYQTSSLSHGVVGKIRASMEQFLRSNAKFPDFIDVGSNVFIELYDWHVKNRQPLQVTRQADGRYFMQFMFTSMILRPEQDPSYVGFPFDKG